MTGHPSAALLRGLVALGVVAAGPVAASEVRIEIVPATVRPGDVLVIHVAGARAHLRGEWAGRTLRLFPVSGGMAALAGVDLEAQPAAISWRLTRAVAAGRMSAVVGEGSVPVRPREFATQRLTLPREQVDLDARTLARVRAERAELKAALAGGVGRRLWRGRFCVPVEGGTPTGRFGLRRIINGQRRSPHAGYDWAAPRGAPVRAANAGRVALVAEHFFAGTFVVLDHGLGLFTLYLHLDESLVSRGETVRCGQPIGRVGASGRATGPHLHFAARLDGARIDPESLLALSLPGVRRD